MVKQKYALLDTDFISKLHITRKDDDNRLIDRILEMPDYIFACHEQITIELGHHNTTAIRWLLNRISDGIITKYSDYQLISLLRPLYGKNTQKMFLFYLKNACDLFDNQFYDCYYGGIGVNTERSDTELADEIAACDIVVGCDHNLGEIKTYLLQQVLQSQEEIQLYVFCSDDKRARVGFYGGGIPCISAIGSFYLLKEKLGMDKAEAKLYFDSWMFLHRNSGQTSFKVHRNTKEMQLTKMDGYEIFECIYNGTMVLMKNGNLKIKEI